MEETEQCPSCGSIAIGGYTRNDVEINECFSCEFEWE